MADQLTTLLTNTRVYLTDPYHWGQHRFERGQRRCLIGALLAEYKKMEKSNLDIPHYVYEQAKIIVNKEAKKRGGIGAIHYNDTKTHADVLELLDAVIAGSK